MNRYNLTLILAGAFCIAVIAAATVMAHHAIVAPALLGEMLLAAYALGLGLGRLVWHREG